MAQQSYRATPEDFNKIGSLQQVRDNGWAKIPTALYQVQQYQFPLTPSEFDSGFGGSIPFFTTQQNQGCPGMQTNAGLGASTFEPFLAMGVGIVAIGESKSFTMPGQLCDRGIIGSGAGGACTPGGLGAGGTPAACPEIGPCAADDPCCDNAALYWGGSTWQFIANFFQAYRLNVILNGRFLIVNESLFDVGMAPVPACFDGFGDSLVPAMPYIREVNDVLSGKGCSKVFLPQNVVGGSLCIGAPTANAAYGCVKILGLSNKVWCFNYPILFLPGWPINTTLVSVENDCCFKPAMRRNSVLDCGGSAPTPDASIPSGNCAAWTVPGGCLSLGLILKGYGLQPAACVDYLTNMVPPGSALESLYIGNPYISSLMSNPALRANLAGVPDAENKLGRFLGQPKM